MTPWVAQPQGSRQINWGDPITRGLVMLQTGAPRDIAGKRFAASTGGISLRPGPLGLDFVAASNASVGMQFSSSPMKTSNGAGTGDFTYLVIAAPVASTTREFFVVCGNGAQEFYFGANINVALTATSGSVSANTNSGGSTGVAVAGAADGRRHTYIYTRAGVTPTIGTLYVDGVPSTATTTDNVQMWSSGSSDYVAGYSAANWGVSAGVTLVIGWNRAISQAEALALTRNPWRVLAGRGTPIRFAASVAGAHDTSGALASDAATIEGTATHLTLHATSGALASDAATVAGTAVHLTLHTTEGALASEAATIAGEAEHTEPGGATHTTDGALSSEAAAIAGTAAHLTLHTTTGALSAEAATIAGTATHLTLHTTSGALAAEAATMAGVAVHSGAGAEVPRNTGAGKSKRRPRVVEIDGEDFVVNSEEEAAALLDQAREQAKELAATAVKRAAAAERRPFNKVIKDARRLLETPDIKAPEDLLPLVQQAQSDISAIYASAIASVEIAALLAKRQREEEDDEDVLLLIA